jgi:hypothetical protein
MRATEQVKVDMAIEPQEVAFITPVVGDYFPMKDYGEAAFVVTSEALGTGESVVCQVMQATDRDGSNAEILVGAAATIDGDELQPEWTFDLDTVLDGEQVTIVDSLGNTTVLTGVDSATPGDNQFRCEVGNNEDAAAFAEAVNRYVPGARAANPAAPSTDVILSAQEPGERVFTVTAAATFQLLVSGVAAGAVAINSEWLGTHAGTGLPHTHVAIRTTTVGANLDCSAVIVRTKPRYSPGQHLAALSDTL